MRTDSTNNQAVVPDQDAWKPWSPAELSDRLASVSRPWCVVGGWALDLWHGKKTREHEDLEYIDFYTVNNGVIELLASNEEPAVEIFQIWCFDRAADSWRVDMMIEPGTDERWVYKRELQITRPRAEMVALTADGIPFLNPSAVLLFKAKHCRPKDEDDFAKAAPKLSASEYKWLRNSLERLHPDHKWAGIL
jgi:hypothetical protein